MDAKKTVERIDLTKHKVIAVEDATHEPKGLDFVKHLTWLLSEKLDVPVYRLAIHCKASHF